MTEADKHRAILKEHGIKQEFIADFINLKFKSFRVALTKDESPKWMKLSNYFYELGKQKRTALDSECKCEYPIIRTGANEYCSICQLEVK